MKSIISKLTFAAVVLFLTSCRENDEWVTEAEQISSMQITDKNSETVMQQKKDSVTANIAVPDFSEGDPPPKTGQQWRH